MTDRETAALWHAKVARERNAKLAAMRREQKLRRELKTLKRSMGAYALGYEDGKSAHSDGKGLEAYAEGYSDGAEHAGLITEKAG